MMTRKKVLLIATALFLAAFVLAGFSLLFVFLWAAVGALAVAGIAALLLAPSFRDHPSQSSQRPY